MQFLAKFGVPMLVLGGGGYTMRNVARCWCYETGHLLGEELPDECASNPLIPLPRLSMPSGSVRCFVRVVEVDNGQPDSCCDALLMCSVCKRQSGAFPGQGCKERCKFRQRTIVTP